MICLLAVLLPAVVCRAELSAEQMQQEARYARDRSREAMEIYERLAGRHAEHAAYSRGDLPPMKAAYEGAAEAWRNLADAFDELDPARAVTLRAKAEEIGRACKVWSDRLEAREKQALAAPREAVYLQYRPNLGPGARDGLTALVEAHKDASEAWGLLAEATIPGVDPERLAELNEKALQAAAEVELAASAFNAIERRERLARDGAVSSPQLTEAMSALKKLDDERAVAYREEMVRAAHLRELDRRRAVLEEQIKQAYETAKKAALEKK